MPRRHKYLWSISAVASVVSVLLLFILDTRQDRLSVMSADPGISIASIMYTLGTNHVYYYGDAFDRILDTAITRCKTSESNTVIWLRFEHPDYGIIPPMTPGAPRRPLAPFRAELIETNGTRAALRPMNPRLQSFRGKFLIMAWEVPGTLDSHSGSRIDICATNGTGSATLQIQ
jgi:hypothetical protein